MNRNCCAALISAWAATCPVGHAHADGAPERLAVTATLAATSDYVYRGISLRDEKPTPLIFLEASYGIFYANALLIGTVLGEDALGRSLGRTEADATFGIAPTVGNVDFNIGVKFTGYPDGRDLVIGTLDKAERDFWEPFAGATAHVSDTATIGATVYWTPNYYYETDDVVTLELQGGLALPALGSLTSKVTATAGKVWSAERDAASPGHGYLFYNAGVEARVDQMIFDLRYWNTDVQNVDGYEQRVVLSVGVALK